MKDEPREFTILLKNGHEISATTNLIWDDESATNFIDHIIAKGINGWMYEVRIKQGDLLLVRIEDISAIYMEAV